MPKISVFWISVVILCAILQSEANQSKEQMEVNSLRRKARDLSTHTLLSNYMLSDNMKSLLQNTKANTVRKKRSDAAVNLDQLEKIVHDLASSLKKELGRPVIKRIIKRKMIRRNDDVKKAEPETKAISRKINKKDIVEILKRYASNAPEKQVAATENEALASIKKEISDIKKSLIGLEGYADDSEASLKREVSPSLTSNPYIPDAKQSLASILHDSPYLQEAIKQTMPEKNPFLAEALKSTELSSNPYLHEFKNSVDEALADEKDKRVAREKEGNDHDTIEKIFQDVEEMKKSKSGGGSKEGFSCDITGSWTSAMGGKVLGINEGDNKVLTINLTNAVPPKDGFLNQPTWKLCGTNPFPKQGLVLITGINDECRQIAAFIGECKYCEGREVVEGQWLIGKLAKGCTDVIASQDIIGDIWRKEVLHQLRKKKLSIP